MEIVILLAEDDPDDSLLLSLALKKAGIPGPVLRVRDGEEAIHYLEGTGPFADRERWPYPSLLLLDLRMPRVSGFEVLEWLAQQKGLPALPVVVVTGLQHPDDMLRVQELGARFCILKSLNQDELPPALMCVADALLQAHGWAAPAGSPFTGSSPPPNLIRFPLPATGPVPPTLPA